MQKIKIKNLTPNNKVLSFYKINFRLSGRLRVYLILVHKLDHLRYEIVYNDTLEITVSKSLKNRFSEEILNIVNI